MAKHRGKKYLEIAKLVETGKLYEVKEALELVLKTRTAKFTETVEAVSYTHLTLPTICSV